MAEGLGAARTALLFGVNGAAGSGGRGLNKGISIGLVERVVLGHMFLWTIALGALQGRALPALGQAEQQPNLRENTQEVAQQSRTGTTQDYNKKLEELLRETGDRTESSATQDYRIGADDLLDVSVFEAPDLNRTVRVSAEGEILLPLLGSVRAAGLTLTGLARVLEELLRHSYMKDPHVGIFLREMQSHPVSVFGAVAKPGVYQIRGAKTLIEVLSMAQGLAGDAGDKVIVERYGGDVAGQRKAEVDASHSAATVTTDPSDPVPNKKQIQEGTGPGEERVVEIRLKDLISSGNPRENVFVHPGDVVKVTRADVVYVVGEVRKPGGFQLNTNENISVLQALALAEGLTRTSAASRARIIRADQVTDKRIEVAVDLKRILAGKAPDPLLRPKDIVFVPNSAGRAALYRGAEAALGIGSGLLVYRTP